MANTSQTKNDRPISMAEIDAGGDRLRTGRTSEVRSAGSLPMPGYGDARASRVASLAHLTGEYKAGRPLIDVWAQGVMIEAIERAMI